MPNINGMLLIWGDFQFAMSLDLNMGYYHIQITEDMRSSCTIIPPWGKYNYRRLPMVVSNPPKFLQYKMNGLFQGFEFIRAYTDRILISTRVDW